MQYIWKVWEKEMHLSEACKCYSDILILSPEEAQITRFNTKELKKKKITAVMGGYDSKWYKTYFKSKVNLHLWPNFFLYHMIAMNKEFDTPDTEIKYLFTCLNARPHLHRVIMLDTLKKYNLLDTNIYSWNDKDPKNVNKHFNDYVPKYWRYKHVTIDNYNQDPEVKLRTLPLEVHQSLINLVTETFTDVPFITEKTYKNFIFGKPFLVFGFPGIHNHLKYMGFKLYDSIIDYSFDKEQDDIKRCNMIVEQLAKLSNKDLNVLNQQMKEVTIYNKQHAIDIVKSEIGIPDIVRDYQKYIDIIDKTKINLQTL